MIFFQNSLKPLASTKPNIAITAEIAPPIAPPTIGIILHKSGLFPQTKSGNTISKAKTISYHNSFSVTWTDWVPKHSLAPVTKLPVTVKLTLSSPFFVGC